MSNFPIDSTAFRCLQTLQLIECWAQKKTGGIQWFEKFYTDTIPERANFNRINTSYCKLVKNLSKLPRQKRIEALELGIPGLQPRDWLKWSQSVENFEDLLSADR